MPDFAGPFETHLTLSLDSPESLDQLRAFAARRQLKCTHIVLARGRTPSQPMLTRHGPGPLAAELAAVAELSRALADQHFVVSRVKLEAAPDNPGVPRSDADARAEPPDRYFEHHVKLLLPPDADTAALARIARAHAAHLSRNALRTRADGRLERFVTQRRRHVGRPAARAALDALLAALAPTGHPILDVEEEYVVHDTREALDAGWIDP